MKTSTVKFANQGELKLFKDGSCSLVNVPSIQSDVINLVTKEYWKIKHQIDWSLAIKTIDLAKKI